MHSPESTQAFAHLRAASLPSPSRRMSRTPAITARGSAVTPPASVTGQASTHFPHCVQASTMSATRADNADSNVTAGCSLIRAPHLSKLSHLITMMPPRSHCSLPRSRSDDGEGAGVGVRPLLHERPPPLTPPPPFGGGGATPGTP